MIDETTGELFLEKRLTVYNIRVYEWLKHHTHPHLVSVRDFWPNDDGTLTVIESYINGQTLENCADALSDEQKRSVILDICDALICLHSTTPSIIHRDIKASNIMVTGDGRGVF